MIMNNIELLREYNRQKQEIELLKISIESRNREIESKTEIISEQRKQLKQFKKNTIKKTESRNETFLIQGIESEMFSGVFVK